MARHTANTWTECARKSKTFRWDINLWDITVCWLWLISIPKTRYFSVEHLYCFKHFFCSSFHKLSKYSPLHCEIRNLTNVSHISNNYSQYSGIFCFTKIPYNRAINFFFFFVFILSKYYAVVIFLHWKKKSKILNACNRLYKQ
jgi:hypothetical protein